jgi:hypothetical protein
MFKRVSIRPHDRLGLQVVVHAADTRLVDSSPETDSYGQPIIPLRFSFRGGARRLFYNADSVIALKHIHDRFKKVGFQLGLGELLFQFLDALLGCLRERFIGHAATSWGRD